MRRTCDEDSTAASHSSRNSHVLVNARGIDGCQRFYVVEYRYPRQYAGIHVSKLLFPLTNEWRPLYPRNKSYRMTHDAQFKQPVNQVKQSMSRGGSSNTDLPYRIRYLEMSDVTFVAPYLLEDGEKGPYC